MKCREVMTDNPVCCLPEDTVGQAARTLRREHVGSVPVITDEQSRTLIGMLTDRDLAIKVVAESRDPNHTEVSDVMTTTIVACREDDDVNSAVWAMQEHQVRRVPIVDYDSRVVGIISQADVFGRFGGPERPVHLTLGLSQAAA